MQTDNLNKYIFASLIIHIFFLVSLSNSKIQKDISQIGEQGMQIQMVLIKDQQDDIQDDESLSSNEKRIIKEKELEQQAIVDNRLQGDQTQKIYRTTV